MFPDENASGACSPRTANSRELAADEAGEGRRNHLAQLIAGHGPIDAHGDASVGRREIVLRLMVRSARPAPVAIMRAINADGRDAAAVLAFRRRDGEGRLEEPMAPKFSAVGRPKAEHRTAQQDRVAQRRADDVLDHPGHTGRDQELARLQHGGNFPVSSP